MPLIEAMVRFRPSPSRTCTNSIGSTTTVSATISRHAASVPEPETAALLLVGAGTVVRLKAPAGWTSPFQRLHGVTPIYT